MAFQYEFELGASASKEVILPLSSSQKSFIYNYDSTPPSVGVPHAEDIDLWVDWGDGTCERFVGKSHQVISHVYTNE